MSGNPHSGRAADAGAQTDIGQEFLTVAIDGQTFGIPVLSVRDVLGPQRLTRVPLAQSEVVGALNLRGRIVTAIDLRRRLARPDRAPDASHMSVVVDARGEPYSLIVDSVGEVLSLSQDAFERNPSTLDARIKSVSTGIYRLERSLLVVLDVMQLLDPVLNKAA
ncbi:MAG: chemotaxis protein CheW [Alphaproteobacteria bacterium]